MVSLKFREIPHLEIWPMKDVTPILLLLTILSLETCFLRTKYDWEIHKGHLEVFDGYGIRYLLY
jgi:hypothetical protein